VIEDISHNIVLVGESFASQKLTVEDFDFGTKSNEVLRLGPMLQVDASPFVALVVPDRIQLGLNGPNITQESSERLVTVAHSLMDVIGRRSVNAVGLNYTGAIRESADSPSALMARLANVSALSSGLNVEVEPPMELILHLRGLSDASTTRLKVWTAAAEGPLLIEVNSHYDLGTNIKTPQVRNALTRFPEAIALSTETALSIERLLAGEAVQR